MIGLAEKENLRLVERFRYPLIIGLLLSTLLLVMGGGISASSTAPDSGLPELTQIQNGTATVTVTAGTTQGTATVTYSPAYSVVPKLFPSTQGFFSFTTTNAIGNPLAFFQSGNTQTWLNMPAIDTEIYADASGEHQLELSLSNMATFRFGVNCVTASNTIGAYLTVMYLSGGGWTEMNTAQRFFIDNTTNQACPSGINDRFGNVAFSTIPAAAKTGNTHFRIDGVGGGGLGDNPAFSSLWIEYSPQANGNPLQTFAVTGHWRVCGTLALCNASPPVETLSTGFIIAVSYPIAPTVTQTLKFTWKAGVVT